MLISSEVHGKAAAFVENKAKPLFSSIIAELPHEFKYVGDKMNSNTRNMGMIATSKGITASVFGTPEAERIHHLMTLFPLVTDEEARIVCGVIIMMHNQKNLEESVRVVLRRARVGSSTTDSDLSSPC